MSVPLVNFPSGGRDEKPLTGRMLRNYELYDILWRKSNGKTNVEETTGTRARFVAFSVDLYKESDIILP